MTDTEVQVATQEQPTGQQYSRRDAARLAQELQVVRAALEQERALREQLEAKDAQREAQDEQALQYVAAHLSTDEVLVLLSKLKMSGGISPEQDEMLTASVALRKMVGALWARSLEEARREDDDHEDGAIPSRAAAAGERVIRRITK